MLLCNRTPARHAGAGNTTGATPGTNVPFVTAQLLEPARFQRKVPRADVAYKDPVGWETYVIERAAGTRVGMYGKLDGQLGMRPVAEEPLDAEARRPLPAHGWAAWRGGGWGGQDCCVSGYSPSPLAPRQGEQALAAACDASTQGYARVDFELEGGKRTSIRLAMEQGMQSNLRKPKAGAAADAPKTRMPDENCIARLAVHGHMTLNTKVKALQKQYAEELWRMRVRLNSYEGEQIGSQTRKTFERPSNKQSKSANRTSRRTLQAAEPHLRALWDLTDVGNSSEGFENLLVTILTRGMPGSGARHAQRWTGKRAARLIWESPSCRTEFEKLRKCAAAPAREGWGGGGGGG